MNPPAVPPPSAAEPPVLLQHPVDAPALPPVRDDPALLDVHRQWQAVHDTPPPAAGDDRPLVGRLDRHLARVAADTVGASAADDRALIGHLIRAVDTLAGRCDELAGRLASLEGSLAEVVEVLGAELTRLRAVVGGPPGPEG